MKRRRLDKALVERNLARSRSHARELIDNNRVLISGFPASKASTLVEHNDHIEIEGNEYGWVGRGGKKIWPIFEKETWDVEGAVALDVGASTGGFTQALLRAGADRVYAVDVGYGQLDHSLRQDDRVIVRDRYNFRHAQIEDFEPVPSRFVMDVSFISTTKLLDGLNLVMDREAEGWVMVKPQFEAGPEENEEGIVTDPEIVKRVLDEVSKEWEEAGWGAQQIHPAGLTGQEGNREFFLKMVRGSERVLDTDMISRPVDEAFEENPA